MLERDAQRPRVEVCRPRIRLHELLDRRWVTTCLLAALILVSGAIRWKGLRVWLWVDEALSVGIASHDLSELPEILRQDGAPPLYYVLLKGWMSVFGRSELALHALSFVFALALVPAALWAGWSLFGRRAGFICALLTATSPFLTVFSTEVRPYSFMALFSLLMVATFLHAFVWRRRRFLPAFVFCMVVLLYTHNWALYLFVTALLAFLPCVLRNDDSRRVLIDGALAFGAAGLLFLPWVPTLLDQTRHTGAPWSLVPTQAIFFQDILYVVGGSVPSGIALGLVMCAGLLAGSGRVGGKTTVAIICAALFFSVPLVLAFASSQFEPNWASRYFNAVIGAAFLVGAAGLARAGRAGVILAAALAVAWAGPASVFSQGTRPGLDHKSNLKGVAEEVRTHVREGDLVVLIQPEQTAAIGYYLPGPYTLATPMGIVEDRRVFDWRDAVERLRVTSVERDLAPLVDRLAVHRQLVLLQPAFDEVPGEREWFRLIHERSAAWRSALNGDRRLRIIDTVGRPESKNVEGPKVAAVVFEKERE